VQLSEKAEAALVAYDWPGNVRELRGVMEAAANLAESGTITPSHLNLPRKALAKSGSPQSAHVGTLEPLAEIERRHILAVYEAMGNNKTHAANVLGISLQTLHRKLKAYRVK
jgi:transcriptional regulator with PAS, ATPase and Fis domain